MRYFFAQDDQCIKELIFEVIKGPEIFLLEKHVLEVMGYFFLSL